MHGMAGKDKSRGVENVDLSKIDGMGNGQKPKGCGNKSCYCTGACVGRTRSNSFRYSGGDNEVRIADDDGKPSDMTIRITADVGEAITGFKALQRELRETTKAARELEQAYKDAEKVVNLSEIKTSLCDCRTINRCDDGKCRG